MTIDDHLAPPLSLAEPWGGAGRLTTLSGGDRPVHWVDFGGPQDGDPDAAPYVLVHGLGGSHLNWVLLAPLLRRHRRVYAVDLAGFGLTPGSEMASTVTANADLLARFLREVVGRPAVVVGNSMGGMVALLLTSSYPALVDRLVLLDPSIPTQRRHLDRRVAATFVLYGIPRVGEAYVGQITARMSDRRRVQETTNLCFADPSRADPAVGQASVELLAYRRQHAPEAEAAFLAAARSLMRVLARADRYRGLMREVGVPVLLVHGDRDRLVPVAAARILAAEHPSWTTVVLPDIGHVPMLEAPDRVAQIVDTWVARPDESAAG